MASWCAWQLAFKNADIVNDIPILCYHRVLPDFIETHYHIYTVLPEQFEAQMAFLVDNGFKSLALKEYAEMALGLRPIERRSVLITFDDGYSDNYAFAWPICKRYNIKLNLFVCTKYLGRLDPVIITKDGYLLQSQIGLPETTLSSHIKRFPQLWRLLTWHELREMQASGVEIGFHGHSHSNYALLKPDEIALDGARGLEVFEREMGYRPKFIALPYGEYGSYTPEIIPILKSLGLDFVFSSHFGRARLPSNQSVFPRMSIHQEDNLAMFRRKLFGAYDWLESIRRTNYLIRELLKQWK